jgi:hypothetical protein
MALFEPEFSGEDYLLQIYEGIGIDVFDFSDELITGVRVVGHITEEKSEIPNEIIKNISGHGFDYPGTLYKFRAEAGKTITINVYGPSIGSSLDPRVALFSPSLEFIKSDDDSGEGNDSKLTFTLTEPGFHYIYVHAAGNHGEESKYFYEVVWE